MEKETIPLFEKEILVDGFRTIVHRLGDGINVEIIGSDDDMEESLNELAEKIATSFEGSFETPDHPGTSHIRLVVIKREENDIDQFISEMQDKGFL